MVDRGSGWRLSPSWLRAIKAECGLKALCRMGPISSWTCQYRVSLKSATTPVSRDSGARIGERPPGQATGGPGKIRRAPTPRYQARLLLKQLSLFGVTRFSQRSSPLLPLRPLLPVPRSGGCPAAPAGWPVAASGPGCAAVLGSPGVLCLALSSRHQMGREGEPEPDGPEPPHAGAAGRRGRGGPAPPPETGRAERRGREGLRVGRIGTFPSRA